MSIKDNKLGGSEVIVSKSSRTSQVLKIIMFVRTQSSAKALSGASRLSSRQLFHSIAALQQQEAAAAVAENASQRNPAEVYQESYKELTNALNFYKTKKGLRELIYKPKNAHKLLSMELYDEEAGVRLTPQRFDGSIKKSAFNKVVLNSSSYEELQKAEKLLLELAKYNKLPKKEHYLVEEHFVNLLIAGAKLNKLPHVLTFLYSNNLAVLRFLSFEVVEVIHVLNNIFKINANGVDLSALSLKEFIEKLNVPIKKLRRYKPKNIENALSVEPRVGLTYIASIVNYISAKPKSKNAAEARIAELLKLVQLEKLTVPDISKNLASYVTESGIKLQQLLSLNARHQIDYLIFKAIHEQFTKLAEVETFKNEATAVLSKITPFVSDFEQTVKLTGKQNFYEKVSQESKFGKPNVEKEEVAAEEGAKEEK